MVEEKLILIAKKHSTWVDIVCTFGCTRVIAEDITQEMYIKIQLQLEKGTLDIMYKDEINYYYIKYYSLYWTYNKVKEKLKKLL